MVLVFTACDRWLCRRLLAVSGTILSLAVFCWRQQTLIQTADGVSARHLPLFELLEPVENEMQREAAGYGGVGTGQSVSGDETPDDGSLTVRKHVEVWRIRSQYRDFIEGSEKRNTGP